MKNSPIISVLMSVYNEKEKYLKRSIDSILNQSFEDFEFIIINDKSDLYCQQILENYSKKDSRIKLIENKENMGLTKSLNKGLNFCCGKYIARIDSDDIADTERLKKQLNFMAINDDYAMCGSWSYIIDENDNIVGKKQFYSNYQDIKKNIIIFNFFTHSSLFFTKKALTEAKGYNEKIKKAQDYDLILKISAKHPIANIEEFLCFHRVRKESISGKYKKRQEWYGIISRLRAIFLYGYPKAAILKIIPAIFYFLFIPHFLEKIIFKLIWKSNV